VTTASRGAVALTSALPFDGFGDIVVDSAHGHVFVSGGDGINGVAVADADGTIEQTLAGLPGATGMALSSDGSTVYVALANGDGIGKIDTATLSVTTTSTGTSTCPTSVAETAGLVWFSYGCSSFQQVGTLDPGTSTVTLGVISNLNSAAALGSSPQAPGVLMVATPDQSPDFLSRYAVTGGATPAAVKSPSDSVNVGGNFGDMAFTPDGADVLVADGGVYHHQVYKTSDLSADGTYASGAYPDAVAVNEDGLVAAGIDGYYDPDIYVYEPGGTTPIKTVDFGQGDANLVAQGGLAFSGSNIYAVTGGFGSAYKLRVVSTLPNASITLSTDRTKYRYAGKVHVNVKVPGALSDSTVGVYARPYGGSPILVKAGHPTSGVYAATVQVGYRTTFFAVYFGDSAHGPTESNAVTVKVHAYLVSKLFGKYATRHHVALYHVRKNPRIGAAVAPDHSAECLYFVAQKPSGTGWHTVSKTGCVGMQAVQGGSAAAAIFGGTHRVGERVRLRAEWHGDRYNLAQYGRWLALRFTR